MFFSWGCRLETAICFTFCTQFKLMSITNIIKLQKKVMKYKGDKTMLSIYFAFLNKISGCQKAKEWFKWNSWR